MPKSYKLPFVTPIHKKGDKITPANHRPISFTSHSMKTAERVVRKVIVEYLEENHIIFKSQHGFRKGRSTLTKLLAHFENVLTGLLDGEDTDAIYLDYAKAFDKVDHELLIQKLRAYGFSSCFTDWISSFLSDRV